MAFRAAELFGAEGDSRTMFTGRCVALNPLRAGRGFKSIA